MIKICGSICFIFVFAFGSHGQVKKDNNTPPQRPIKSRFDKLVKAISKQEEVLNEKSEDPYAMFDGKIIRKIIIKHVGFEKTVLDTTRSFKNFVSNAANKLHSNTKEHIIRNNL